MRRQRPNCLAKVAQPCAAFQATKGARIASATASPANSAGEASQRRSDGATARARPTPAAKKTAVNFDSAPARGQPERDQPARLAGTPELDESRKAEGPEHDQRRVGVTKTAPTRMSGIATHISAASAAFSAEPKKRQAISAMRAGIAPTKGGKAP